MSSAPPGPPAPPTGRRGWGIIFWILVVVAILLLAAWIWWPALLPYRWMEGSEVDARAAASIDTAVRVTSVPTAATTRCG